MVSVLLPRFRFGYVALFTLVAFLSSSRLIFLIGSVAFDSTGVAGGGGAGACLRLFNTEPIGLMSLAGSSDASAMAPTFAASEIFGIFGMSALGTGLGSGRAGGGSEGVSASRKTLARSSESSSG